MRRAKISADEGARLGSVRDYEPADDAGDPALQEVAELAARRFGVPTALVTLVRETDQLFLARTGIDACGTDRDISFCSHALESDDLLVVPDAALDPRFADNPLVLGPLQIRFYAGVPLRAPSGHVLGTLCVIDRQPRHGMSARDRQALRALGAQALQILEHRRLVQARAAGGIRFRQVAALSSHAAVSADAQGRISFWNDAAARLLGIESALAQGRALSDFLPVLADADARALLPIRSGDTAPAAGSFETDARRADGARVAVAVSLFGTDGDSGEGCDVLLRDEAMRRRSDELAYLPAHRDPLTDLPTRAVLDARLAEHVARGEPVHLFRLALSDLPEAQAVATAELHPQVLKQVAQRIVDSVGPGDTVTRLGDDFAILCPAEPDEPRSAALVVADRILGSLIAPVDAEPLRIRLGAQIGIACFPQHAATPEALMAAADTALRQARRAGRRARRLYGEVSADDVAEIDPDLRDALRLALMRGEFELFYQPQVDLASGTLVGAEALIRWNHPQRGLLTPADFLDHVEHGPLAVDVGTWVLEAACSQAVRWRQRAPDFRMGVNLFDAQLHSPNFAGDVLAVLDRTGLDPSGLELEITEKIMLDRTEAELASLTDLHGRGVGVAFDDFGTGYASLCMLKDTPLTRLKVDRSFVKDIAADGTDALIVAAVATLGAGLGVDVLAEGIEDETQWALLRASGCRTGQGYWFGRPMPAAAFEAWMHGQSAGAIAEVGS